MYFEVQRTERTMLSDTRRPIGLHSPAGDSAVTLLTIPC